MRKRKILKAILLVISVLLTTVQGLEEKDEESDSTGFNEEIE